jgi:hypothetical protein
MGPEESAAFLAETQARRVQPMREPQPKAGRVLQRLRISALS